MSLKKFDTRVLLSAPHMGGQEMQYIERAFKDNWIVPLGPNVNDFEKQMVEYLGEKGLHAVAMNSGTSAIHIALILMKLQPGEEVFCSSATFVATANPILYEKGIPVFVDSEPGTWNLCPKSFLKAVEAKKAKGKVPRILVCAELYGMGAAYNEIEKICQQYKIEIIEDSAEALGSKYHERKCGTFGRFGILSFNGNKIITTSGGGMLITHSKEEADKALFLITQARDKAPYYLHSEIGYNYRMSNVCAGIGLGQMKVLDERVEARRKVFQFYRDHLHSTPLEFPTDVEGYYSNHWLSTALLPAGRKSPTELLHLLDSYNVEARHVWKPLHTQPIFKNNEFYTAHAQPVAEKIFNEGVCLPSSSFLTEETLEQICNIIKSAY
ncbi:MAG: DegT/DnrJ/EryC1/StrS family aminotransferase [Bdellovibrionota bacterium]